MSYNEDMIDKVAFDTLLKLRENHFKAVQRNIGNYSEMKLKVLLKFLTTSYEVENLGNLSIMMLNVKLMQMATVMIVPYHKDLPMLSINYIFTGNKRKLIFENYAIRQFNDSDYLKYYVDFQRIQKEYPEFPAFLPKPSWHDNLIQSSIYKVCKKKDDKRFYEMVMRQIDLYLKTAAKQNSLSQEQKQNKSVSVQEYIENMVEKGGAATDFFLKDFGKNVTLDFFNTAMFGCKYYTA